MTVLINVSGNMMQNLEKVIMIGRHDESLSELTDLEANLKASLFSRLTAFKPAQTALNKVASVSLIGVKKHKDFSEKPSHEAISYFNSNEADFIFGLYVYMRAYKKIVL
jgi:hypothetical protein